MDDEFERLLGREEEIRHRVERGDITDEEAAALRDLVDADDERVEPSSRLRVTAEQLRRLVDEGIDPEALRAVLDLVPGLELDDAIDVLADHEPCVADLRRFGRAAVELDLDGLRGLLEYEVDASALEAAAAYGCTDPVGVAVRLTEVGADAADLLRGLRKAGVVELDDDEVVAVAERDIDPTALRRMVDACDDMPFGTVLELCEDDVDPGAVRRLRDQGIDIDPERVGRRPSITLGLNLNLGRRHLLVGAGRERIRRDGTVTGWYVGDVTIDPGLTVDFGATLVGNLTIGVGADVTITGHVTGAVVREEPVAAHPL